MSLQRLLDRAGNRIELPYLGLSFRKFGYKVFHDGEFASTDEFNKRLKYLYGEARGLHTVWSVDGLSAIRPRFGIFPKTNIHIATFPPKNIPAGLRSQYRMNVLGHEETHALFRMNEIPRLATEIAGFLKQSKSTLTDLLNSISCLSDGEEYDCDVGGFYALARAMGYPPDTFKRGLVRYYSYSKERIERAEPIHSHDVFIKVLAEMGVN